MAALGERTKKKKAADRILFVVLVATDDTVSCLYDPWIFAVHRIT